MVVGLGLYLLLWKGDLLSVVFDMSYIKDSIIIIIVCGGAILLVGIYGLIANRIANVYMLIVVCHLISCRVYDNLHSTTSGSNTHLALLTLCGLASRDPTKRPRAQRTAP